MMLALHDDTAPCRSVSLTPEATQMVLIMRARRTVNREVRSRSPKQMLSSDGSKDRLAVRVVRCCFVAACVAAMKTQRAAPMASIRRA